MSGSPVLTRGACIPLSGMCAAERTFDYDVRSTLSSLVAKEGDISDGRKVGPALRDRRQVGNPLTLSPFRKGERVSEGPVRGSRRYGRVETLPFRRFNSDALLRHEVAGDVQAEVGRRGAVRIALNSFNRKKDPTLTNASTPREQSSWQLPGPGDRPTRAAPITWTLLPFFRIPLILRGSRG